MLFFGLRLADPNSVRVKKKERKRDKKEKKEKKKKRKKEEEKKQQHRLLTKSNVNMVNNIDYLQKPMST